MKSFCIYVVVLIILTMGYAQNKVIAPEYIELKAQQTRTLTYLDKAIRSYRLMDIRNNHNWPFKPFGHAFPVGHVSHSYQYYYGDPYFHHGVDIRVDAGTPIYCSAGGKVVNIENYMSGHLYWEVAILDNQGFLWQYHHVDKNTIPQNIFDAYKSGKKIDEGTHIGNVVYWPVKAYGMNFHHIHLNVLDGNKNYINPLLFFIPPTDKVKPEIEKIYFTADQGSRTLPPDQLKGKVDIIVKARDKMDDQPYELTIYKLEYEITDSNGNIYIPRTLFWQFNRLPGGGDISKHVHTVFKSSFKDGYKTLRTYGDYNRRVFYFIVTNHKNGKIDESGVWNTQEEYSNGNKIFPDGNYKVTVFATDLNGNSTYKTVDVTVDNS